MAISVTVLVVLAISNFCFGQSPLATPLVIFAPAPSFQVLPAGVSPIAECWYAKNWRWLAVWSVSSDTQKSIPVGAPNNIVTLNDVNAADGRYPSQPTDFQSGFTRYVFVTSVPFFASSSKVAYVQWKLDGRVTKINLDERAYQCFPAKFALRVQGGNAGTPASIQSQVAQQLSVNQNRVNVSEHLTVTAGVIDYVVQFLRDPDFDYDNDFRTTPTNPDVETEPLDPQELLVAFSRLTMQNPNLLSSIASTAGGTYESRYSTPNSQLRTQSGGIDIVSPLYPKDPTTPQGIVGNPGGPSAALAPPRPRSALFFLLLAVFVTLLVVL